MPEKILLAILICSSLAGFWYRFRRVANIIAASKPDADFKLGSLAPRIRNFIFEVLLQTKVIRQRPIAGAAHAFVFWGFCAFALITLNHFAVGFGFHLLDPAGSFGRFYFALAAAFAVAVAASIAYLAARRFIERPVWFGKVAPESGIIAGLIFVLMVTYLAGLATPEGSTGSLILWWGAHPRTACVPSADPSHQASAPCPEPGYRFPETPGVQ